MIGGLYITFLLTNQFTVMYQQSMILYFQLYTLKGYETVI
jgi:hypothetical protein